MKTYGGVFLTSALVGGECTASRSGHFSPIGEKNRYALDRRLGRPQNRSGQSGENWPYHNSNSDPSVVQLVLSILNQLSNDERSYPWQMGARITQRGVQASQTDCLGQRCPTGGPRAGSGPRLDLLWPAPSHRFIFSGVGVIEGNKIDWWKFKYLLNIIGAT
jgi:hypothetical protein